MAIASTNTTAQHGAADRLAILAASLKDRISKARTYRKTYNELNALSDATLADLGLHRSMIRRVAYQAVYES